MKKNSRLPKEPTSEILEALPRSPDFNALAERVIAITEANRVFIGGIEATPQMRELLRDQAGNVITMQLWEILHASIIQEAAALALLQSTNFEQVQYAKAQHHFAFYVANVIHRLANLKPLTDEIHDTLTSKGGRRPHASESDFKY